METLKQRLFNNWHFMRFVRFGFGSLLLIVAIGTKDLSSLPISMFFLFTAITGIWCSDTDGNYAPETNASDKEAVTAE